MGYVLSDLDMRRACIVSLVGVDTITERQNGIADGVAVQYKCDFHGQVTIVFDRPEDVADLVAWGAFGGTLLWGGRFKAAFEGAHNTVDEITKEILETMPKPEMGPL